MTTYGEKAVGLTFNPSGDKDVETLKKLYAHIIDFCATARDTTENGERKRLFSIAITEAQTAQMWAVKAVTWKD
jgi:hypothetical protein